MDKFPRNQLCWCGSGIKYKYCHLGRENQLKTLPSDYLKRIDRAYSKKCCLHPNASSSACKGDIIKAHTIQRKGGLDLIARDGHVYSCARHNRNPFAAHDVDAVPNKVGTGQASIFTGFCAFHDNQLFTPLEKRSFEATPEQIFLLQYRSLCREYFAKIAEKSLIPEMRLLDRGSNIKAQKYIQEHLDMYELGVDSAIEDFERLKRNHDSLLETGDFSSLRYYIVLFDRRPDILCAATHLPEFDFTGNEIQVIHDRSKIASWLHFSLLASDQGGAAVFSWLGDDSICSKLIESIDTLRNEDLPQAILRYTFEFFGNVYFSPNWWDELSQDVRRDVWERQLRRFDTPREADCLIDNEVIYVNWLVTRRRKNI